jgi:hypothetical protein
MEAESKDRVLEVILRLRAQLEQAIEPIAQLLNREALDVLLLVHNHERAEPGETVSATVVTTAACAEPGRVLQTLMAVVRRIVHRAKIERLYERAGKSPLARLGVVAVDDREMALVWNPEGQCIGELLLKRGESRQIAGMLGLLTRHDYSDEQRAALGAGLSMPEFDARAGKLERDVAQLCAGQPLAAIGAAVHGLVCGNPELREVLGVIDATCEDETKRARVATIYVP